MDDLERIESLEATHAELEDALRTEINRPHPDPIIISDLKKRKLRIKDQLAGIAD